MKSPFLLILALCSVLIACKDLQPEPSVPIPSTWGPTTYQVDVLYQNGATFFQADLLPDSQLVYSLDPVPSAELPFRFNDVYFGKYREVRISSLYPIRSNWFRISNLDCVDPGDTQTGVEFAVSIAREQDYLLIGRLDSTYWDCLRASASPINFSFQVLLDRPVLPSRFSLQGFYDQNLELLHLKARRNTSGLWLSTPSYQVFQAPGGADFSVQILKHPHLGEEYSLVRFGSPMWCLPQSVWIGLPGECLEQADWEVHRDRIADRLLLDVVVPDCYLDCLHETADGFEFQLDFFQYQP